MNCQVSCLLLQYLRTDVPSHQLFSEIYLPPPPSAAELSWRHLAGTMEQDWESSRWGCWVSVIGRAGAWGTPSVRFSCFLASDLFFSPCTSSEHHAPRQSPPGQGGVFGQHPHLLSQGKVRLLLGCLCNCFIPGNYSSIVCSDGLNHL